MVLQSLCLADLGNSTQLCGGFCRLTLFTNGAYIPTTFTQTSVPGWNYTGCYTDRLSTRALSAYSKFDWDLTVEKCLAFCNATGSRMAGVEYGTQCYCGSNITSWSIGNGNLDPVSHGCYMPCGGTYRYTNITNVVGNGKEYCGGPLRLDVYTHQ
jgi:hypothetical protein